MPGLFGGDQSAPSPETMATATYQRPFNVERILETRPSLGIVHHGMRDPGGYDWVKGDGVTGAMYGTLFDRPEGFTAELVEEILAAPDRVLPTLDGSFALACLDRIENRFVLATDKLGTRSMYYTRDGSFAFGSELTSVLTGVENPTIDTQSVADILTMIHVWGDRTLVEEVQSLRPASYVIFEDGERSAHQYWGFTFDPRVDDRYVPDVASAYTDAVTASLESVSGTLGIWLSGGLDSRMLVSVLARTGVDFDSYTYDRPTDPRFDPFRDDIDIARSIAETVGVSHEVPSFSPETLIERLPELVDVTDGQLGWNTIVNLSHVFELDIDGATVIYEGPPPLMSGEKVGAHHLGRHEHPADVLSEIHTRVDQKLVKDTINADVEPKDTFIDESRALSQTGSDERITEVTHLMYNSRKHFSGTNKVARARVGTRVPLASSELLDLIGQMPRNLRRKSIPFTGGRIPHVPSKMKLALVREMDGELSDIPYSATQLPPTYPHVLHGAGFVLKSGIQYAVGGTTAGDWYRSNDAFREYLDELLDDAGKRDLFDAEVIDETRRQHLNGESDHIVYISGVTTIELFHRHILDRWIDEDSTETLPRPVPSGSNTA